MEKMIFEDFERALASCHHKKHVSGIEVNFFVDDCIVYRDSWLGKMIDLDTNGDCFWYGLVPDGSQAYDYGSFEVFVNAKVFYGSKSLKDIWGSISFLSLGGGPVCEMLPYFLGQDNR